jgi:hypothetical protein
VNPASSSSDGELARKAVDRAGGLCCLCGRPCKPEDARRHSEPGPFGDSPNNFAAICRFCRAWVDEGAPAPARYIVHLWQGPRVWMRHLQRALFGLFLGLVALVSVAYAAIAALVLYDAHDGGPWHVLGAGVLLVFVFVLGGALLRGGFRHAPEPQRVHHSFDAQTLNIRDGH